MKRHVPIFPSFCMLHLLKIISKFAKLKNNWMKNASAHHTLQIMALSMKFKYEKCWRDFSRINIFYMWLLFLTCTTKLMAWHMAWKALTKINGRIMLQQRLRKPLVDCMISLPHSKVLIFRYLNLPHCLFPKLGWQKKA